jgi:hypothetical protein
MPDPKEILAAAGAEVDATASNVAALVDRCDGAWIRHLKGFARFYKLGYDLGGARPSRAFFRALLGHGALGFKCLANAYFEATREERTADETRREVDALLLVTRIAQTAGAISWDANDWRPFEVDPAKARLVAYVPRDVDERVRALSFVMRRSLSDIVSGALVEHANRFEKASGPLPKREAAQAVAP